MQILFGAKIIDGTGAPPSAEKIVVIKDRKIRFVGDEKDFDKTDQEIQRINLSGFTLLPGLIDCHVHITSNPDVSTAPFTGPYAKGRMILFGAQSARKTLEAGFTTVQDMMASNDVIFPLRDSIAAGETKGARILASGKCITITGGHGTQMWGDGAIEADGPQEVLKAVRTQIKAGADLIKIMASRPAFSPPYYGREAYQVEEMRPGVEEAHRAGLRVCAHSHSKISAMKNAILAGVDSVEHAAPVDREIIEMMLERGTFMVPTMSVSAGLQETVEDGTYPYGEEALKRSLGLAKETEEAVAWAHQAGVNLALGTDAAMPRVWHGGNARELELFVECGLSPMQALLTATSKAAQNIGRESQLGTIEAGKLADLVVVDGNPLADIRILQDQARIKIVFKEGDIVIDRR
jgi:imidazolonepropionase-like amidohydrolase